MFWDWFWEYGIVILFYAVVIILIYVYRKKFDFEGKIIALYRTKIGLKLMDKIGRRHPKFIVRLANVGVWAGFLGMLFMVGFMIYGLHLLVFVPSAEPLFSPVLPGVHIPGSPITLPLFGGLIALFAVVAIHEFSHGVVARAFNIPVKNSGFVMFGPLPGAFVEPDEKKVDKSPRKTQLAIFAAGPWSNILLSLVLFFVLIGTVNLGGALYHTNGIVISGFLNQSDNLPGGRLSMLQKGDIITGVDNISVASRYDMYIAMENKTPGETLVITTNNGAKSVKLEKSADNESVPMFGITINQHTVGNSGVASVISAPYFWIFGNPYDLDFMKRLGLIGLIYVLSLGIGVVNLLPIGPTDGGRMYLLALQKFFKKKTAMKVWSKTAAVLIFVLIVLVFVPIIRNIFMI